MPKTHSTLDRIKATFDRLVARYENEMQDAGLVTPDIQVGINPPPGSVLDEISSYDGTAGLDNRPDFVREDDEQWST